MLQRILRLPALPGRIHQCRSPDDPSISLRFATALAVGAGLLGACVSEPEPIGRQYARPSATITAAGDDATFRGGDSISYAGARDRPRGRH